MKNEITYVGTLNGIREVWCGFKPDGAIIDKETHVLYPDKDKKLRKKGEEELLDFVILKGDDNEDNYEEVDDAE